MSPKKLQPGEHQARVEFNGTIECVQVDLEPDDHTHMIDTDHMAHVRLVKQ